MRHRGLPLRGGHTRGFEVSAPHFPSAGLATRSLSLQLSADPELAHRLVREPLGDQLLKSEQARAFPVALVLAGERIDPGDFAVTALFGTGQLVVATCRARDIEVRLSWSKAPAHALRLLIQARTAGAIVDGEARPVLLDYLHPGDPALQPEHDTGRGPVSAGGRPLIRTGQYPLPASWQCGSGGLAVLARMATEVGESDSYRWCAPPEAIPVRLCSAWLDVCELTFMACAPGWLGVVAALREQVRAGMDLGQYHRSDLSWYRSQWLQHFTFLYGREIFDHQRHRFDVDRLLDDGMRFGSYDGLLLWPAYPRIGVDERSQWDFYDDLPGGRDGLRALAARARKRGTRIFLPYLPWDAPGESRHGKEPPAARELARLVAEVEADGVFLDTTGAISAQFRREIDRVSQGVVFCAEMQPGLSAIEQITGSWDQASHDHVAEIDLQRFLFPEHPSFAINRHAVGAHRKRVIGRALFNGAGMVVWQDVFGEVLPYTDAEADLVRATISTLRRQAHCFRGAAALPLIPTCDDALYANAYISLDGRAVVVVFNDGDAPVRGGLVAWTHDERLGWSQVGFNFSESTVHERPFGAIDPGQVLVFASTDPR